MRKINHSLAATNPGNMNIVNLKGSINAGFVTISQREYAEYQELKARLARAEAAREEAELRAEQIAEAAELEIQTRAQEHHKEVSFWAKAWYNILFFYQGAVDTVHYLTAKIKHDEKLLSNPQLEPEERLVLQAYEELTVAPKHRDAQGRALVVRKDVMTRTGLSESTCYRVDKKLEAAGHLDAKVRYNPIKNKKDRFVKLAPAVRTAPESLSTATPKAEPSHPICHTCESDDTKVTRKTVQTVTCYDCGTISTTILPERSFNNPLYHTTEQDPANPGIMLPVNLKGSINPGARATGGSSA